MVPRPRQRRGGSPLAELISPQGQLAPQRARSEYVSTPRPLPANLQYGTSPRGPVQSSRYTGGVVQTPFAAKPLEPPPDFQAPSYGPLSPVAPVAPPSFRQTVQRASSAPSLGGMLTQPPPPPPGSTTSIWNPKTDPIVPWTGTPFDPNPTRSSGELPQRNSYSGLATQLARAGAFGIKTTRSAYEV